MPDNPIRSTNPDLDTPDFTALEAALRDARLRACASPHPFGIMLRLGRAVARLVQALRLARGDAGLPRTLDIELTRLVDKVRDAVARPAADPALTLAGHRAGGGVLK